MKKLEKVNLLAALKGALKSSPVRLWIPVLIGALALLPAAGVAQPAQEPDPNRYIVKFLDSGPARAALNAAGGTILLDLPEASAAAARLPAQALAALRNHPAIEYIERDHPRYPMAQISPYGIAMVQADQVSDAQAGNRMICIIDSGYSLGHEDLPDGINVQGTNDIGTGNWYEDGCAHGTYVAGTIVALDNDVGVLGVLPNNNLDLHIVKVFGEDVFGNPCAFTYSSNLISAANVCANNGANVINMSLGGLFSSITERDAFQSLYDKGILHVAAAGNRGTTQLDYPASYDSVISVAAVDSAKQLADFSQRNSQVELAAPGVLVRSTVPMGTGTEESLAVGSDGYEVVGMEGSPAATGTGPLVDCGLGAFMCPGGGGQVCLIERGEITFADKVLNCQAGGGVGAVIYNNVEALLAGTLGDTPTFIPSVGTSDFTGSILLGRLGQSATVTTGLPGNYAFGDGTSMAAPHVSGVAALVWSHDTSWTNQLIRDALAATAEDLGDAGRDNSFGWGLVQAADALALLTGGGGAENDPPTASFTFTCTELACDFDGSGSFDNDGDIVDYSWDFGDGNSGSGAIVSHFYAADGAYTVTLTVTDDEGATGSSSQDVTVAGAEFTLSATGYRFRGVHTVDLAWNGATSTNVDVYRNGALITTTANDGFHTDSTSGRGKGSYEYQVCEQGTLICSNTATVTF